MTEGDVREAFRQQAEVCAALGSPFTARLCRLLSERLDRSTAVGARVLDWPGRPFHDADALPLRLAGGLHALARAGVMPEVTAAWPPSPRVDDETLWRAVSAALAEGGHRLDSWLDGPPQTNEVGRSAALMAGLLVVADRFPLPVSLYELGASAGLNLNLDRYAFRLGETAAGEPSSRVRLEPTWTGPSPPASRVRVALRRAVDRAPLDATLPAAGERLTAYVWADQRERLTRLEAALGIAADHPPRVEPGDAADWLEANLALDPEPGLTRVVQHTIAFQYFPPEAQARVVARLNAAGARATEDGRSRGCATRPRAPAAATSARRPCA
ncbi:MAG TPA: DUF2332 family protein [Caulobacteraceae bacterium]